jgi:dTDP-4-amino-4,6-dideoxygalactose transaminase
MADKLSKLKSFGHRNDDYFFPGINGKNSELHAAMGLCILPKVDELIAQRRLIFGWYDHYLAGLNLQYSRPTTSLKYNYSYYPVIFKDEVSLKNAMMELNANQIFPRRYFFPALNRLPYVAGTDCPIAEDISSRVLCLPLYVGLEETQVQTICRIIEAAC